MRPEEDATSAAQSEVRPEVTRLREALSTDPRVMEVGGRIAEVRIGPYSIVTLNSPEKHNALNLAAWRQIAQVAEDIAADPGVRVVMVRGAGCSAFCAGADISEFPATRATAPAAEIYDGAVSRALTALAAVPVPVVALIDGLAVGGGLELASACDLRFASSRSRFGIPIGRLGVTLGLVEATSIARLIGSAELKYLLFTGRLIDAERALRVGLVQSVVAPDSLVDEAVEVARAVATGSLPTILSAKIVVDLATRSGDVTDTENLNRSINAAREGADLAEGVKAFLERRAPLFPSRRIDG